MPVDNELYNQLSDTWWSENSALSTLRTWYNPVRFAYFRRVLLEKLQRDPLGLTLLDVGCGGGLLAEEFARLGCQVTGVDPSASSLVTAREHAQQSGLNIAYQVGVGELLPFADASFDLVTCCDVLEHVDNTERVLGEIARVLKPGGLFFYDTLNRTFFSWFAVIQVAQVWQITRILPTDLHDWKKFIKPQELRQSMHRYQLQPLEFKGISQRANPLASFNLFLQQKRGAITLTEMGKRLGFYESENLLATYIGYAVKADSSIK